MQDLEKPEPVKHRLAFIGAMIFLVVSTGSLVVLLSGNGVYKQWAGVIFMALIASLIVFRSLQEFIGNRVYSFIPYILATFLTLTIIATFAPQHLSLAAWGVYLVLVVVAGFYWLLHIIVHAVKTFPFGKK